MTMTELVQFDWIQCVRVEGNDIVIIGSIFKYCIRFDKDISLSSSEIIEGYYLFVILIWKHQLVNGKWPLTPCNIISRYICFILWQRFAFISFVDLVTFSHLILINWIELILFIAKSDNFSFEMTSIEFTQMCTVDPWFRCTF